MSASQKVVSLIGVLEDINSLSSEFGNKKDTGYLSVVYQNASKQYRTLEEVLGPKPEFLPTLLGTETNKAQYERLITPLKQQLLSFINWYNANAETINDSFSYEAIEKVIDSEVEYRYGKERKEGGRKNSKLPHKSGIQR
jgi:hypothetical protein